RHRRALARNLALFPPFLRQLGPALERVGRFAEQTTPVFTDLRVAAPAINQAFVNLPAFSNSSSAYFQSLGKTAQISGPALTATLPLFGRLKSLGSAAKPAAANLSELLSSLRSSGGLERLMDFIFLGTGSNNGYDALGHFLRAEGVGTACLTYAITPAAQCSAKLSPSAPAATGTAARAARVADPSTPSLVMERTLAVLKGATPAQALAQFPASAPGASEQSAASQTAGAPRPVRGASARTTSYTPPPETQASGLLLNYLLGN